VRKTKFFISAVLAITILIVQVGGVFAAPESQASPIISGTVLSITLETNPNTGITTVVVEVAGKGQDSQKLRVSQETAVALGLVSLDGDGNPVINKAALSRLIEIDPATVIPENEVDRHPVASALETVFSDISGINYDVIMKVHLDKNIGFGVIAQALWLTRQLHGDAQIFEALIVARETGNYDRFTPEGGTTPKNWGQLRKAILEGKLGTVISDKDNNGTDKVKDNNKDKSKDNNKDKSKDNGPEDKEPKDKEK